MSTTIYFIKATYHGNIYKLSDFYNAADNRWLKPVNRSLEVDMVFNDGITILKTQTRKLADDTLISAYTHISVPYLNKIYKITKIDRDNYDSDTLTLQDDPFIANYHDFKGINFLATRTNNVNKFNGVNDVSDTVTKKNTTILTAAVSQAGKVGIVFVQSMNEVRDTIKLDFNTEYNIENRTYSTLAQLIAAFPEFPESNPVLDDMFQKFAKVGSYFYQRVFVDSWLRWKRVYSVSSAYTLPDSTVLQTYGHKYEVKVKPTRLSISNTRSVPLVIPVSPMNKYTLIDTYNPSNYTDILLGGLLGPGTGTNILAIRLIDSSLLGNMTMKAKDNAAGNEEIYISSFTGKSNIERLEEYTCDSFTDTASAIYKLINVPDVDVSYTLSSPGPKDYPPFVKYILDVYGSRHEINPRYLSNLKVSFSITPQSMSYFVWSGNKQTVLAQGFVNNEMLWTTDQLASFYTNNPTYKDQFNLQIRQQEITSLLGVAGATVGGAVVGGPLGAIAGYAGSTTHAVLSRNYALRSEKLREKGLRLQPDIIQGNNVDLGLNDKRQYGIILYTEEAASISDEGYTAMTKEYALRGFPCNLLTTITALGMSANDVFTSANILEGQFYITIKNNYITEEINKKLMEGVTLVA